MGLVRMEYRFLFVFQCWLALIAFLSITPKSLHTGSHIIDQLDTEPSTVQYELLISENEARTSLLVFSITSHKSSSYRKKIRCQTSIRIKEKCILFLNKVSPKGIGKKPQQFKELNTEINKIALSLELLQMKNAAKRKREHTGLI